MSADPRSRPNRRDVLALGVGAFVVAAIPFAARSRRRLVRRSVPVMGTIADLAVVHDDRDTAEAALAAAVRELHFVDRTMSRHQATSDVGRANLGAARDGVPVSDATASVLASALAWAETTDGAFDPCLGRAAALWEVTERTTPPAATAFSALAGRGLWRSLDLAPRAGAAQVRFAEADTAIDLGGIAKGYAVDRAVRVLREHGIDRGLVNAGGDLYALGHSEDGDPWKVGIRHPDDPSRLLGDLTIEDAAVATSGDYERAFQHGGRTFHHLLDPATAAPREVAVHSLSVQAATCLEADAAATAAFGMAPSLAERALAVRAPSARIVSRA